MTKDTKKGRFGNIYGNMLKTPVGRLQMPYLMQPSTSFGAPKYRAIIIFDSKNQETMNSLNIIKDEGKRLLAEAECETYSYPPLRDGNDAKISKYEGFPGNMYLCGSHKQPPRFVDRNKQPIDPSIIMSGMLVRFVVTPLFFPQNGAGISYQLNLVQLWQDDGTRFLIGPDPTSLLDALEDGDDEEKEAATDTTPSEPSKKLKGKEAAVNLL